MMFSGIDQNSYTNQPDFFFQDTFKATPRLTLTMGCAGSPTYSIGTNGIALTRLNRACSPRGSGRAAGNLVPWTPASRAPWRLRIGTPWRPPRDRLGCVRKR